MCKYAANTSEFVVFFTLFITQFYSQCDSVSFRLRVSCLCGLLPSVPQHYTHPNPPHTHTHCRSPQTPSGRRLLSTPLFPCHSPVIQAQTHQGSDPAIWPLTHTSSNQTMAVPPPHHMMRVGVTGIKGWDRGFKRIRQEFGRISIKGIV